eukprot:453663-Rhodomonas_salina.2
MFYRNISLRSTSLRVCLSFFRLLVSSKAHFSRILCEAEQPVTTETKAGIAGIQEEEKPNKLGGRARRRAGGKGGGGPWLDPSHYSRGSPRGRRRWGEMNPPTVLIFGARVSILYPPLLSSVHSPSSAIASRTHHREGERKCDRPWIR